MKTENEENKCMSWIHSYPEWNQRKKKSEGEDGSMRSPPAQRK
jgi:hypothetical protein